MKIPIIRKINENFKDFKFFSIGSLYFIAALVGIPSFLGLPSWFGWFYVGLALILLFDGYLMRRDVLGRKTA